MKRNLIIYLAFESSLVPSMSSFSSSGKGKLEGGHGSISRGEPHDFTSLGGG